MKKLNLLLVAILSICAVSCGDGSKDPLSKKEALNLIIEECKDTETTYIYIPSKITKVSDLDYPLNSYILLEKAGLLTMADTTITINSWYNSKTYPAKDIKLTETGTASIMEELKNKYKIFGYKYEIDKIVDMKLLRTATVEEMNAEIFSYIVYYTGTIVEASTFANATDINIKDKYPFDEEDKGKSVMTAEISAIYRDGKLINASVSIKSNTDDMDANFDEYWLKALKNY